LLHCILLGLPYQLPLRLRAPQLAVQALQRETELRVLNTPCGHKKHLAYRTLHPNPSISRRGPAAQLVAGRRLPVPWAAAIWSLLLVNSRNSCVHCTALHCTAPSYVMLPGGSEPPLDFDLCRFLGIHGGRCQPIVEHSNTLYARQGAQNRSFQAECIRPVLGADWYKLTLHSAD
jgi:hypothetical protein